jgi:hypothetical protein
MIIENLNTQRDLCNSLCELLFRVTYENPWLEAASDVAEKRAGEYRQAPNPDFS